MVQCTHVRRSQPDSPFTCQKTFSALVDLPVSPCISQSTSLSICEVSVTCIKNHSFSWTILFFSMSKTSLSLKYCFSCWLLVCLLLNISKPERVKYKFSFHPFTDPDLISKSKNFTKPDYFLLLFPPKCFAGVYFISKFTVDFQ